VSSLVVTLDEDQIDELVRRIAAQLRAPEEDRWMSAREAAAYLGIHVDTLRRAAAERRIPFTQDGPRCKLWFRRSDLDIHRGGLAR
jgi:excisionase family DNA binding protein